MGLKIDLPRVARGVGYKHTYSVSTKEDLLAVLKEATQVGELSLIEVKVKKGNRKDLGRPTTTPIQNKDALMSFLAE